MKFADFVCFEAVIPQLNAADRDGVITELVSALVKAGRLEDKKRREIIKAVINREQEASTGMGKGVAVPHVKHEAAKDVVAAIGLSSGGIDFTSLDSQLVYSVILLISPVDNPDRHLQAATKSISSVFKNIELANTVNELNMAMARAKQMDKTMALVLDRVSDTTFQAEYEGDEEAVSFEQIDSMITERAQMAEGQVDDKIDEMLGEIEKQLKKEQE